MQVQKKPMLLPEIISQRKNCPIEVSLILGETDQKQFFIEDNLLECHLENKSLDSGKVIW